MVGGGGGGGAPPPPTADVVENLFIVALMWSLGALLELDDRLKVLSTFFPLLYVLTIAWTAWYIALVNDLSDVYSMTCGQ